MGENQKCVAKTCVLGLLLPVRRKRACKMPGLLGSMCKGKGKEKYLCSAFIYYVYLKALRHESQCYLQIHHICLSFLSFRQMVPPLIEVGDIQLQLTTHLSTPKGWKAELAWLVDP